MIRILCSHSILDKILNLAHSFRTVIDYVGLLFPIGMFERRLIWWQFVGLSIVIASFHDDSHSLWFFAGIRTFWRICFIHFILYKISKYTLLHRMVQWLIFNIIFKNNNLNEINWWILKLVINQVDKLYKYNGKWMSRIQHICFVADKSSGSI